MFAKNLLGRNFSHLNRVLCQLEEPKVDRIKATLLKDRSSKGGQAKTENDKSIIVNKEFSFTKLQLHDKALSTLMLTLYVHLNMPR